MVSDSDRAPPVDSQSSGQRLAAAREGRGWSVREVAGRLRIRPELVDALERDDYAAFGATAYARGQLRNYARLVGVEFPQALTGVEKPVASAPGTLARRAPELHPHRPRLVRWGGLAIAVVLVVLGALWAREGRGPESADGAPAASMTAESASVAPVEKAREPAGPAPEAAAAPAPESPAPPPALSATPGPSITPPNEPTTTAPAAHVAESSADIRIRSRAVSWVEVTDHTGRRLVYELVSPGPERAAQGVPPLRVLLGNAPAVELLYNGAPVDLPAGQHVVRLTLGAPPSAPAVGAPPAPAAPGAPTP